VKKCISCAKDIPDTAFHCVFCGAKQGAPQTAGPAQRTIMGYAAADLQKLLPNQPGAAPQGGYVPAGSEQRTMMAGVGGAPMPPQGGADARTMMAGVGGAPMPPNSAEQRTMMAQSGVIGGPGEQRTMMAGAGGAPMPPMTPMQPPQPQYGQQPPMGGYGGQPQPGYGQPPQYGQPQYAPQPQPPAYQPPAQPMRPAGEKPRYLASQSAARDMAPTEPWAGSLRLMMILFGLAYILTFIAPDHIGDNMTFGWSILTAEGVPLSAKLGPLTMAAGGVLALLFGLLPVPTSARGIVAVIAGLAPIIVSIAVGGGMKFGGPMGGWQGYVLLGGLIVAPAGLLIRSQYRSAGLGRIMSIVGAGLILALFLVPDHGSIPVVEMAKSLGGGHGLDFGTIWMLVLALSAALGLILCLMPSSMSAGTGLIAKIIMCWMFGLLLFGLIKGIVDGAPVGALFKQPQLLLRMIDALAVFMLSGYGLATVFGKSLEA
jgi:hypothetical protein